MLYKGKPVIVKGEPIYETEYSDRLLEFVLKANDRKKFGDQIKIGPEPDQDDKRCTTGALATGLEKLRRLRCAARGARGVAGERADGGCNASAILK